MRNEKRKTRRWEIRKLENAEGPVNQVQLRTEGGLGRKYFESLILETQNPKPITHYPLPNLYFLGKKLDKDNLLKVNWTQK